MNGLVIFDCLSQFVKLWLRLERSIIVSTQTELVHAALLCLFELHWSGALLCCPSDDLCRLIISILGRGVEVILLATFLSVTGDVARGILAWSHRLGLGLVLARLDCGQVVATSAANGA